MSSTEMLVGLIPGDNPIEAHVLRDREHALVLQSLHS